MGINQLPLTSSTELTSSDWTSLAESEALDGDFASSSSSSSSIASVPATNTVTLPQNEQNVTMSTEVILIQHIIIGHYAPRTTNGYCQ